MNYSVLMSVYYKENPSFLKQSMQSILQQTQKTNDFVLVCDGPLNEELDTVISEMKQQFEGCMNVVRLAENVGLGRALNVGIKHCKNELVARMDSDDISYPDRCVRQIAEFQNDPALDICSGGIEEFEDTPEHIESSRIPPETHEEIYEFAKKRCPFNHPCVMYRKSAVEAAGGYQDFYHLEDYFLWVRMLLNGSKGYNLQQPLLWMRAGNDMYKRRAGWTYAKSQIKLFKFMRQKKMIGWGSYCVSCAIRTASALAPNGLRRFMFEKLLRKNGSDKD